MNTRVVPVTGCWFQHVDKGQEFEVVAVDEAQGLVEIQYFDGTLEEIDLESWNQFALEPIEAPEDWTGPLDRVDRDDLGYSETGMEGEDWAAPAREWRRPPEAWAPGAPVAEDSGEDSDEPL